MPRVHKQKEFVFIMKQRKECDWEPFSGLPRSKQKSRAGKPACRQKLGNRQNKLTQAAAGRGAKWVRAAGKMRNAACKPADACSLGAMREVKHVQIGACPPAPVLHPRPRRAKTSLQARYPLSGSHLPPPAVTVPSALQPHPAPLSHVRPWSSREGTFQGTWTSHLFTSC